MGSKHWIGFQYSKRLIQDTLFKAKSSARANRSQLPPSKHYDIGTNEQRQGIKPEQAPPSG